MKYAIFCALFFTAISATAQVKIVDLPDVVLPANGYLPITVTGTTSKVKASILGVANVKWFGAKDDGTTSCVPAVRAAIAAGYNTIVFPSTTGSYLIDTTINFTSDVTIIGDRYGATIITPINDHSDVFTFSAKGDVRNLNIKGSGGVKKNFVGLHFKLSRFNVDNVRVTFCGLAYYFDNTYIGTVNNSFAANSDTGWVAKLANGCDFNITVESSKKGFQITNSKSITLRSCMVEGGDIPGQTPVASTIDNCQAVTGTLYFEGSDTSTFHAPHLIIGGTSASACYGVNLNISTAVTGGNQYPIVLDNVNHAVITGYIKVGSSSDRVIKTTTNTGSDVKVHIEHTGANNTMFTDSAGVFSRHLNYFPNSHFDSWFNGWSSVALSGGATMTKENTIVRKPGSNTIKLHLPAATGTGGIIWRLQSPYIEKLRSKTLTMFAWVWVPAITEFSDQPTTIDATLNNVITQSVSYNGSVTVPGTTTSSGRFIKGDWNLEKSTVTIQSDATEVQLKITIGGASYAADGNEYVVISDVYLIDDPEDNNVMNGEFSDAGVAMNHFHSSLTASGTAAPNDVDQYFNVGDIVYNSSVTSGSNIGWVCTTAGMPGTWTSFGTISATGPINNSTSLQTSANFNIDGAARVTGGTQELWESDVTNRHRVILSSDVANSQFIYDNTFSAGGGWGYDYRFGGTSKAHFYTNGHYFLGLTPADNGYLFEVNGTSKFDGKLTVQANTTNAGLNFGGFAGNPSSLSNGDIWYNTTAGHLYARLLGVSYQLDQQSSGGTYTADESTLHLATSIFSIKSTYPGQSSITTLGIIGTGTWNATAIGRAYGGLGKTTIGTSKFPFSTDGSTYSEGTARQGSEETYTITSSIVFTGTTAPSGTLTATYRWTQILNQVTVRFYFTYATPGTAITNAQFDLPADLPAPEKPTGFTADGNSIAQGYGGMASSLGADVATSSRVALHALSTSSTGYSISVSVASTGAKAIECTVTYFTSSGF